jgi:uncharacterized membrane protein YfcA
MTVATTVFVLATMVATSFLSGLFGMAGGLVLIGVLLTVLPVPTAMALHAVTQVASNGWRGALWIRHARFRIAAAYGAGALAILGLWSLWRYVPPVWLAMLMLGAVPFSMRLVPDRFQPDPLLLGHGAAVGAICMALMLTTGVAGPFLDAFFLKGTLDRRVIVATKAVCQTFGHAVKFVYFGVIVDAAGTLDPVIAACAVGAAALGTVLARQPLERMGEAFYRRWARRIVDTLCVFYVGYGIALFAGLLP